MERSCCPRHGDRGSVIAYVRPTTPGEDGFEPKACDQWTVNQVASGSKYYSELQVAEQRDVLAKRRGPRTPSTAAPAADPTGKQLKEALGAAGLSKTGNIRDLTERWAAHRATTEAAAIRAQDAIATTEAIKEMEAEAAEATCNGVSALSMAVRHEHPEECIIFDGSSTVVSVLTAELYHGP